ADISDTALRGTSTVTVNPPVVLDGRLDPSNDSGESPRDGVTNIDRPTFSGMATSGAIVRLFTDRSGAAIGQAAAGPAGLGSITTASLTNGAYSIFATATNPFGLTGPTTRLPLSLVIDTISPMVVGLKFDRKSGRVTVILSDDLAGIDPAKLLHPSI